MESIYNEIWSSVKSDKEHCLTWAICEKSKYKTTYLM